MQSGTRDLGVRLERQAKTIKPSETLCVVLKD